MSLMTDTELAALGGGKVCYIKILTAAEAKRMMSDDDIQALPDDVQLYKLTDAAGAPIALTDSFSAAYGHAAGEELTVVSIH